MVNGVLSQADLLDDSILQAKKRNVNTCELFFTICLQASRKLRVLFIKCSNNCNILRVDDADTMCYYLAC